MNQHVPGLVGPTADGHTPRSKSKKKGHVSGLVGLTAEMGTFIDENLDREAKPKLAFRTLFHKFMTKFPEYTELTDHTNGPKFLKTKYKHYTTKKKKTLQGQDSTPVSTPTPAPPPAPRTSTVPLASPTATTTNPIMAMQSNVPLASPTATATNPRMAMQSNVPLASPTATATNPIMAMQSNVPLSYDESNELGICQLRLQQAYDDIEKIRSDTETVILKKVHTLRRYDLIQRPDKHGFGV